MTHGTIARGAAIGGRGEIVSGVVRSGAHASGRKPGSRASCDASDTGRKRIHVSNRVLGSQLEWRQVLVTAVMSAMNYVVMAVFYLERAIRLGKEDWATLGGLVKGANPGV